MNAAELLTRLLDLFRENIGGAEFRRAYAPEQGPRRPEIPVVTGEVDSRVVKPGSQEVKLRFRLYLPESAGADAGEELFAAMCALAREAEPGFSAIARGPAGRDGATGLLAVPCTLSFLTRENSSGGEGSDAGFSGTVTLGGREAAVTGVRTTYAPKGTELVSVGESAPFAVVGERTEITVELEGLDVTGLDRLAAFTAVIGGQTYTGCRWKTISDALGKAAFTTVLRGERV